MVTDGLNVRRIIISNKDTIWEVLLSSNLQLHSFETFTKFIKEQKIKVYCIQLENF